MSEWFTKCLSKIADIQIGGTPSREVAKFWASANEDGDYWVSIADLKTRVIDETKERITKEGVVSSNVKRVPSGTLIMSFKLSIGRAAIAGHDLYTNEAIAAIIPDAEMVSSEFLYYALPPVAQNAITDTAVKGSTLNKKSLGKLPLIYPRSHLRQKKIATILQTIDQVIEKTEALIEKYGQIKAGMMHDLFTRGLTPDGKLRPPRDQAPELYKETSIGRIPKEWVPKPLESIATYQHGRPFPSSDYASEGTLLLRPGNLHVSGFVVFDDAHCTRIPTAWEKIAASFIVKKDNILMNLTAQSLDDEFLGRVCRFEGEETALLNQRIARFIAKDIEPDFLYWILKCRQFRRQIEKTSQGTKVQHLYNRDLNRVVLGVPEQEEQVRIANSLTQCVAKIRSAELTLQKMKLEKHGLMQDLLTGKVQVKVDDPEAAHV